MHGAVPQDIDSKGPPQSAKHNVRSLEIDSLRAFAVLAVLWTHTIGMRIEIAGYRIGGYHGVLLFFVISGFLITDILLRARSAAVEIPQSRATVLRAFYVRRFLRICPLYYSVLLATWLAGFPDVRESLGWHASYLSNWHFAARGALGGSTAHLWSLAVEEQFYLFWPWFGLFVPAHLMPAVIAGMIVTGPLSRLLLEIGGANSLAVWITTPTVLDALGLGCLLAYAGWQADCRDRLARWCLIGGLVTGSVSGLLATFHFPRFTLDPLAWALLCVWLVHRAAHGVSGPLGLLLRARPLAYVGTISYGIYLLHLFVVVGLTVLARRLGLAETFYTGAPLFAAVTVVSISAAACSWRYFERPINALKHRFEYVQRPRLAMSEEHRL